MRVSRTPEGRDSKKRILLLFTGIAAIAAVVAVVFISSGSGSLAAKNEQAAGAQDADLTSAGAGGAAFSVEPTEAPEPTATAIPAPTAAPTQAPKPTATPAPQPTPVPTAQPEARTVPLVFPDARFGEVLEEGMLALKYPRGEMVKTWYSFQVDTETRDITLYFAQYDDALESILSTVKLDNYTRGMDLDNAEVLLNFPDGSTRILYFDGEDGTISLEQQYNLPVGPMMFSSGLRRALVYYGMKLQDETGDIEVELHLDLSGLSQSEGLEFKRVAPDTVNDVLYEIQSLVEQIEDMRTQS